MSQSEYLRRMLSNNAIVLSRNKVRDSSEYTFIANARAAKVVPTPVKKSLDGCVGYANSVLNGTGGEYIGNLQVKIGCAVCSDPDPVVNNYIVTPCIVEDHTKYPWVKNQQYVVYVPEAPYNVTGTTGNGQVTLSWTGPMSDGGSPIKSYTIFYTPGDITVTSSTPTVTITGLSNGAIYTFTVFAVNNFATSKSGGSLTGLVPSTVPNAPTSLSATTTLAATTATVAFTPPFNGGRVITNYRFSTNGSTYTAFSPAQTTSPVTISGLTNGTTYTLYLKADNINGSSVASSSTSVVLFRNGSITFSGNAQYLTITSSSALSMSTGNFTIEGWVRVTNFTAGNWSGGAGGFTEVIQVNNGTGFLAVEITQTAAWRIRYNIGASAGTNSPQTSGTSVITAGIWYHFAMVRNGLALTLYVTAPAGTASAVCSTTLASGDSLGYTNSTVSIGATAGGLFTAPFSFTNIRVVPGTALYTAAGFSAPTAPLSAISGTTLLMNTFYSDDSTKTLTDGSTNNATVNASASPPTPSTATPFA